MAEITVKIIDKTPELMQKLEAAIGRFVRKGAFYIEGQLKTSMRGPKSGRRYKDHIASAPGESPAVDSSNLIGSITQIFPSTLEALIGTPVEYAVYLEEGAGARSTRDGKMGPHMGGMLPRPLWEPVRTASIPTLEKLLDAEIAGIGMRV